jgi:Asp/Glu/hydantoin racemase
MTGKIAVIHATHVSIAVVEETAASLYPQLQLIHLMDEGMSSLAKAQGRISGANLARVVSLIHKAEDLGVDGILLSCTIFSPFIDLLSYFADIPIIAADVAMFEKAASTYARIGVVVTFRPTIDSVNAVLERCKAKGMIFKAEIRMAEGAFDACAKGCDDEHNRLVADCAKSMVPHCDAIVLAQMSQMRALPLLKDLSIPVLTSPPISFGLLMEKISAKCDK